MRRRERPDGDGAGDGSSEAGRVREGDRPRRGSARAASRRTVLSGRLRQGLFDDWRRMKRARTELTGVGETVPTSAPSQAAGRALPPALVISASVTRRRPASSSSVKASAYAPLFLFPNPPLFLLFSSISICTLRARRLAPCGVSPPGLLPVRAPSVVSHHLRRLSPPLLA